MANTLNLGNGDWASKENSLLGYNSENGNYKPLPFDFTRASNGTFVNKSGLIETAANGVPRIDFLGNTKGAMLLEPQRSNLVSYSEKVLLWSTSGTVVRQDNVSISPDGKQTAGTITSGNDASFNRIRQNYSVSANTTCTASLFIKKVQTETNYLGVGIIFTGGTTDVAYISFDSVNGIARNMDSRITAILNVIDYGTYWRLEATATDSGSNTDLELSIYTTLSTDGINVSTGASSVRTIWGMQLELNSSYATSLINTQGSAVTRVADVCNNGGNDQVINSTEGTLYFEGSSIANDGTFKRVSIGTSDNLFANSIQLRYNTADNSITYQFRVGNVYQADLTITANTTNVNKIACVWKINRFEIWVNGVKQAEDTSGSVPSSNTFNSLFFGKTSTSLTEPFYGNCKDIRVYNTALTDQELIALTTI